MKTGENINSSEYFTNSQAHGSNDRAFSGTSMQQHHQDPQDFNLFFNFNGLCIISESLSITNSDEPTLISFCSEVFIEEMRRSNGVKYLLSSINTVYCLSAFEGLNGEHYDISSVLIGLH